MPGIVRFRFVGGPFEGRVHECQGHDVVTVGRARESTIRLPADDHTASRHHLVLEVNPPEIVLRDLGSRQGTRLNGRHLGELTRDDDQPEGLVSLHPGDEFEAGRSKFRVEVDAAAACENCGRPLDGDAPCAECATTQIDGRDAGSTCRRCGRDLAGEPALRGSGPPRCPVCESTSPLDVPTQPHAPATPAAHHVAPPTLPHFAGYTAVRQIGAGGMGAVYLAQRDRDRTWVALKVLLARIAVQEDARHRFSREARLIDQLRHPNIVGLLDRGSVGQAFYFAMEFCPAGSAAQLARTRGGRLALGEATEIVMQALEGLDHAHQCVVHERRSDGALVAHRGVVHRDVKPGNLLLSGSERGWHVKLSDFGLAKGFETAGLSGCTSTGYTGGSLPFMAPEQLRDFKHVRAAGDIWSLGATLYTLLAGQDPRHIRSRSNPLHAILEGTIIPLRDVVPEIPDSVARVVEGSLRTDQAERPASAGWMISDLSRAVYGPLAVACGVALTPHDPVTTPERVAILMLAPRPTQAFSPRAARDASRQLHASIVRVVGHTGVCGLALVPDGALVLLDDAVKALDLARRVELYLERKRVPLRRVLHVASHVGATLGVPSGAGIEWAVAVARSPDAAADAFLVTQEAASALPAGALHDADVLEGVRVGPDGRGTRLYRAPGPPQPR